VLLPRNAGPAFNGGFDRAQTGGVNELQCGADGVGGTGVANHVKRDNRAETLESMPGGRVSWVARQAGIARQSDVWVAGEAFGQCYCVALRPLQPKCQRSNPADREFDAGHGATFSGEPGLRSRPAEISHDSTEPGLPALCPVVSFAVID
jgi:hypothetical protein